MDDDDLYYDDPYYDEGFYPYDEDDEGFLVDGVGFAREGSALRASTRDNPRIYPCPNCEAENVLTPLDVARGYQCDRCADRAEGKGGDY